MQLSILLITAFAAPGMSIARDEIAAVFDRAVDTGALLLTDFAVSQMRARKVISVRITGETGICEAADTAGCES